MTRLTNEIYRAFNIDSNIVAQIPEFAACSQMTVQIFRAKGNRPRQLEIEKGGRKEEHRTYCLLPSARFRSFFKGVPWRHSSIPGPSMQGPGRIPPIHPSNPSCENIILIGHKAHVDKGMRSTLLPYQASHESDAPASLPISPGTGPSADPAPD